MDRSERSMANDPAGFSIDAALTPITLSFTLGSKQEKLKMILRIIWIKLTKGPKSLYSSLG
jgi:hypothetical protein